MFLRKLRSYLGRRFYIVGIRAKGSSRTESSSVAGSDIVWIKYPHYRKDWMADPFIYEENEKEITIFAEQMDSSIDKGKLVRLTVSLTDKNVTSKNDMLELDTHLSFPIFIKYQDGTYVYPENYQSGTLKIYKYNKATEKLEEPRVLINEPLLDTQIIEINGVFYAMGIKFETGSQEDTRRLYIWKAPTLFGPYKMFQEIVSEDNTERGAGRIVEIDGSYYRPVQDCNGDYGRKVIFKKLIFSNGKFSEISTGEYLPSKQYPEGLHTYNSLGKYEIIDGIAYNCGRIITYINRLRRR